ncbi:protein windpipe [Anthonomus grandis grandis]|uniref:protein windpipe n=1 Tax=Anthonomus grandis grandis TaxID=2921223 RepID=UPI0021663942|nr:protein windpipe [Anthonomus grandis grandis]
MWIIATALLFLSIATPGSTIFRCPKGADCPEEGAIICSSFQFLDELGPKQYKTITKLIVTNALIDKVPAKVKYLKNLKYFDISGNSIQVDSIPSLPQLKILKLNQNNIKDIRISLLPKNIEELHLSNNFLTHIPKDWSTLKSLKAINIGKNLIDCSCQSNNIHVYQALLKHDIKILAPVICHSPKQFAGKNIEFVHCTYDDDMINDQPLEGSGDGEDIFNDTKSTAPIFSEEYFHEENEIIDDKDDLPQEQAFVPVNQETIGEDEGSGQFEGSGAFDVGNVLTCIVNCVSPEPLGSNDSVNDSVKAPEPQDQLRIIAEDIINPIMGIKTTVTTTSTTVKTLTEVYSNLPHTHETTEKPTEIKLTANVSQAGSPGPIPEDPGLILKTRTEEVKKTASIAQNNYAVYIVVICGLLLTVVFLICLVKKQKAKRLKKNRRDIDKTDYGEEMKTLEKPTITPINEKNGKPTRVPEQVPLINEQNGKTHEDAILNSFRSTEDRKINGNTIETSTNGDTSKYNDGEEEPILREKFPNTLTPLTERVTIRASEIPDSMPKTPVLVHRQKNSEGEVVSTVLGL